MIELAWPGYKSKAANYAIAEESWTNVHHGTRK